MTPDQLLYGLSIGFIGSVLAGCGMCSRSLRLVVVSYRLALVAVGVLFVSTAAIALGIGDPIFMNTIGGNVQPLFYGAVFSVDRFAAMFMAVGAGTALLGLPYANGRERAYIAFATAALAGLAAIGNIIGLGFFLAWLVALVSMMKTSRPSVWRTAALVSGVWLAVSGLFVASGGALFSDLQSVAQYAGSLTPSTILFGTVLSALATITFALSLTDFRKNEHAFSSVGAVMLVSGAMYVAWRSMLFIMPVLNPLLGLAVMLAGVLLLICMRRDARLPSVLMAQLLVGLGMSVYAIAHENWQLMNLSVFASVLMLMFGGIASAGQSALRHIVGKATHGVIRRAPWLSLNAALVVGGWALMSWMGWWMFLHGAAFTAGAPQAGALAVTLFVFTLVAALLSTMYVWRWIAVYFNVFFGEAPEDGLTEPAVSESWPLQVAGVVVVLGALLAPVVLVNIGAEVLTMNAGSLAAVLMSGNGAFAPALLVVVVAVLALGITILRGAVAKQEVVNPPHAEETGVAHIVPFMMARSRIVLERLHAAWGKITAFFRQLMTKAAPFTSRIHELYKRLRLSPAIIATVVMLAVIVFVAL